MPNDSPARACNAPAAPCAKHRPARSGSGTDHPRSADHSTSPPHRRHRDVDRTRRDQGRAMFVCRTHIPVARRRSSVIEGVSSKRPLSLSSTTPPPARRVQRWLDRTRRCHRIDRPERGIEGRRALVFAAAHRCAESIMEDDPRRLDLRIAERQSGPAPDRSPRAHSAACAPRSVPRRVGIREIADCDVRQLESLRSKCSGPARSRRASAASSTRRLSGFGHVDWIRQVSDRFFGLRPVEQRRVVPSGLKRKR